MDCAQLLKKILKDERGVMIELPSDRQWRRTHTDEIIDYGRDNFFRVEDPQDFDVVLMRMLGNKTCIGSHVGLYCEVNGGSVMHSMEGIGAVITETDRLRSLNLETEGFYRAKPD